MVQIPLKTMKANPMVKIGISVGDLNGIGCEVALKTFQDARMLSNCTPIFFASSKTIAFQIEQLQLDLKFHGTRDIKKVEEGKVNVFVAFDQDFEVQFGQSTKEAGALAVRSLEAATAALKAGHIDALVTAPINKSNIQSETFSFPGHTDYLAKELGAEALMFMIADGLRVGLLTDHIAVSKVSEAISTRLIRSKVHTMMQSLRQDFGIIRPKIALLGINPHSGDNGTIGEEDEKIMKPAVAQLFEEGQLVFGPYSADGFFGSNAYQQFDAVLAAYHDQGLIPFKTLSFGRGVNFTAGLSKVRTSPDHGTAYEIAGKGIADESSFKESVFAAIDIVQSRADFEEMSSDVLKSQQKKEKKRQKFV